MDRSRTLAALLLLTTSLLLLAGCGGNAGNGTDRPSAAIPAPGPQPASASNGPVVDVSGAVAEPGVYEMPAGARVHEAIDAAGGLTERADASTLNRAAPVVDGQQILVPEAGASGAANAGAPSGAASSGAGARISINAADAIALEALPGIGPVTAGRIVAERESGGPYSSVDDLDRVPGIGPATIESLRDTTTA